MLIIPLGLTIAQVATSFGKPKKPATYKPMPVINVPVLPQQPAPQVAPQPVYQPQPVANIPVAPQSANQNKLADAELLLTYKKLLDNGAITEEEFEQKKRELI